ncbi:phage tail protein [Rhizobium wenxiniae]|uniref:phage tail protein n=1 Tax=Rhizobium wenxiniae TaxID=1737357 RepID=UPI003C18BBD8
MGLGGGKGGSKVEIAEYTVGIHAGICAYGDGITLIAAKYADKEIWRGALGAQNVVAINKPDLFGDVKKEGGVKGLLWWLPGGASQVMPESLAQRLGLTSATCPGFRGFCSVFLTGIADVVESGLQGLVNSLRSQPSASKRGFYLAANNPYLRSLKFRCRRAPIGLNGNYALIQIENDSNNNLQYAANPVHIIYECMTNRDWGMGEIESAFDKPAWEKAAETIYKEKMGMSLLWTRQSSIQDFIGEVANHIQCAIFVDPASGKHSVRLLRGDYDVDTLPLIDPSNADLTNFARKAWGELANEIVVTFTNPETGQSQTVTVQDLAGISAEGAVISSSRNYYGFVSKTTAQVAAERDLAASVNPIATCQATVSRQFWKTVSSSVVRLSWPEYDIEQIVFRVSEVSKDSNTVVLDLYEDIFGLDRASYLESDDTAWVNPSLPPSPASYYKIGTAPAFMVAKAMSLNDPSELDYPEAITLVVVGADSGDDVNFDLVSYVTDVNGITTRKSLGTRPFYATWSIVSGLVPESQSLLPTLPGLRGAIPEAGDFILIGTDIDDYAEIATVQSVTNDGYLINRGMLDTIPREWAAGTRAFVLPADMSVADETVRSVFESTSYWILPRTTTGTLALTDAPQLNASVSQRPYRPNRPANVKVNDTAFGPTSASGDLVVTWANRNRILESTQAFKWTEATVSPESGQTTRIEMRTIDNVLITAYTNLAGTTFTIPASAVGTYSAVVISVWAEKGGLRSLQAHTIRVNRNVSP